MELENKCKTPWFQSKVCVAYLKINQGPRSCYTCLQQAFYKLVHNIDLSCNDKTNTSLAHAAASCNRPDIIRLLHGNGISCDSITSSGETPLHLAVIYGSIETIETLLECGADITKKSAKTNKSILHYAAQQANQGVLSCILKKAQLNAIDIESRDACGNTPLHIASFYDIVPNIKMLLKYNANPCALNNKLQTPFCLAILANNTDAIFALSCASAEKAYIDRKTFCSK
jgi:ankyrin repeat protein